MATELINIVNPDGSVTVHWDPERKETRWEKTYSKASIQKFWDEGDLSYLLYDYQLELYDAIWEIIKGDPWFGVINVSRQFGKTFVTTLIFLEICLRKKRQYIDFLAEDRARLKNRVFKAIDIMMDTCPYTKGTDKRPYMQGSGKEQGTDAYIFPSTGSQIFFYGIKDNAYRGGSPNMVNLDEAAFIPNLEDLVMNEIEPSFTQTKGKLIVTSTPGDTDDNYYNKMVEQARDAKTLITFTDEDNANIDKTEFEAKKLAATQIDGSLSNAFRREHLAELIPNTSLSVLPAWSDDYIMLIEERAALRAQPQYKITHKFISIDYGTKDFTVISYYFYDYWCPANEKYHGKGRLVKEHSTWMRGEKISIGKVADDIKDTKLRLWNMGDNNFPTLMICDSNDPMANQTLQIDHNLPALAVKKERYKSTMVSKLNDLIARGRFWCCDDLLLDIGSYRSGVWENMDLRGIKFARSKTYGHYDCIDGDVYLNLMARDFYDQIPETPPDIDLRTQHGPENVVQDTINTFYGGKRRSNGIPSLENMINPVW